MSDDQEKNGKLNGTNGHDKEADVIRFPSLAERDRIRKEQEAQENAWRTQYQAGRSGSDAPFFNMSRIPPMTIALMAPMILIFLASALFLDHGQKLWLFHTFGFIPARFTIEFDILAPVGLLTHVFIHSGIMHIAFNAVMLLALGSFIERQYGPVYFLKFFFLSVLGGALFHFAALNFYSTVPVVGASGGISGLFAGVLMLMYRSGMMGPLARKGPWPLIAFWIGLMLLMGLMAGGNVAWQAHLGGFLTGLLLVKYLR